MNDKGLLLIHKFAFGTKITPQNLEVVALANQLFDDYLDKEEKKRMFDLLLESNSLSEMQPIKQEVKHGKVI